MRESGNTGFIFPIRVGTRFCLPLLAADHTLLPHRRYDASRQLLAPEQG